MVQSLKFDWYDERVGCWTRVRFDVDGVTFHLGRNHYAGAVFGSVMFAGFFALLLSASVIQDRSLFFIVFAALLPFFLLFQFRSLKRQYKDFPIRAAFSTHTNESSGRVINSADIKTVLVRENTGRTRSDQSAKAQIYLLIHSSDRPILVYQHYLNRRHMVVDLGQRIADHLDARLENEFKVTEP